MTTKEQPRRIKKSLTKTEYTNLLWLIGKSERPLSSTQIEKEFGSKYVHEMLKVLCPSEYSKSKPLFIWEEIIKNKNNGKYKLKLIERFNQIFKLNWKVTGKGENDDDDCDPINNILNFHLIKDKKDKSKEHLTIFHDPSGDIIGIQLDRNKNDKNGVMLVFNFVNGAVQKKKHFDIIFERDKKTETSVYALMPYDDNNDNYNPDNITIRYLKVTFKDKVEKLISEIKSQNPDLSNDASLAYHFPEIQEMKNDKRNWRYSLNFKGLLLYLLGESKAILSSQPSRKSKNRIRDVISNPLVIKIAPFLECWQYFFNEHYNFNVIDLLLKIAVELENQFYIDIKDDFYLLKRASERYFVELENYFYHILDSPLDYYDIKKVGYEKHDELLKTRNKYRQEVIIYWLNKFKTKDEEFINYLQRECDREAYKNIEG